jgi:pyruvate kinase
MTALPKHKTRIVCTIGPASKPPRILERMIRSGMNVARLNLAHGDFDSHRETIAAIRAAAAKVGKRVTLLADLPGPKLRVGELGVEVTYLRRGQLVQLAGLDEKRAGCEDGSEHLVIPLSLPSMPTSLKLGNDIFLNDGLIQLRVCRTPTASDEEPDSREDVFARVVVGGELRYRDGISLPGIDLGISAFTEHDRDLLAFALSEGVEAVGISFVQGPEDVLAVRSAARSLGGNPFIVAKIERSQAVDRIDSILEVADGLMVARGDLGVDIPIERIAVVQKLLIRRANMAGRPVITATQMLESMTENRRPTRAEVTDVSNAILDGTDCVMLSEETAMGQFPVDAVSVMARVAESTERYTPGLQHPSPDGTTVAEVLAQEAAATAELLGARYIVVPTETGTTARNVARLRPRAWIVAFSPSEDSCHRLQFSRGVHPVHVPEAARASMIGSSVDWHFVARRWINLQKLKPGLAVVIQGNNRLEVVDLVDSDGAA